MIDQHLTHHACGTQILFTDKLRSSTDKDSSLRIESFVIISLPGVFTKLN